MLLNHDCKLAGSFNVLDIKRIGLEKIIIISSVPRYNEVIRQRGVKSVVEKDYHNLDAFSDFFVRETESMVNKKTDSFMISRHLLKVIQSQFRLPATSLHGPIHWKRVEAIGTLLATRTRADVKVVSNFAYLHDAKRFTEDFDPDHGQRAMQFCIDLSIQGLIQLSPKQLKQLFRACEKHSDHRFETKDRTVATCLDADRLDVERLGIVPYREWLLTQEARGLLRLMDQDELCLT